MNNTPVKAKALPTDPDQLIKELVNQERVAHAEQRLHQAQKDLETMEQECWGAMACAMQKGVVVNCQMVLADLTTERKARDMRQVITLMDNIDLGIRVYELMHEDEHKPFGDIGDRLKETVRGTQTVRELEAVNKAVIAITGSSLDTIIEQLQQAAKEG